MPERSPDNRLNTQTSPYLLQHANDPVAWQPWDDAALAQARAENKPILLSVGYSACHWCHVMAHESFQDEETARLMNEWFISIKVDREERPDLDKIYQTAQTLISQRTGGWPLTMFLTPDGQVPFFGGTYFPPSERYGLPGFKDLLQRIHEYYTDESSDLASYKEGVTQALGKIFSAHRPSRIGIDDVDSLVLSSYHSLEQMFDPQHGGFGREPKFPNTHFIYFLLDMAGSYPAQAKRANHMAFFTLSNICGGGIYDHVGGGFYRYSVDNRWMIPHFEKMTYDNASLLGLCARAFVVSGEKMYWQTAQQTADWIIDMMQADEGGYYAALDADSEGEEGKYYVWSQAETERLWGQNHAVCAAYFGTDNALPNFEGRAYHLWRAQPVEELAERFATTPAAVREAVGRATEAMLAERAKRVAPFRDEKILTSWNALMIKNMTLTGRLLGEARYLDSAERALNFIIANLWDGARLHGSYKDGQVKPQAYLDDYAFLIDALLEACQARWNADYIALAVRLADTLLAQFEDKDNGGFFFTPADHESLIQRPRMIADEATPSAYGVSCHVLIMLGSLLAKPNYLDSAERAIAQAGQTLEGGAVQCSSLLRAALLHNKLPQAVVVRAKTELCEQWAGVLNEHYHPSRLSFVIDSEESLAIEGLSGLSDKAPKGDACAYWCEGLSCQAPLESLDALRTKLAAHKDGS